MQTAAIDTPRFDYDPLTGEKLGLHGNNKSRREIELALDSSVAHLVVDSLAELAFVETIAAEREAVAKIVLRVTTGVHAGGHEYISTAHEDQKFGLSIASGTALRAIEETLAAEHLELVGLHSHIGSQILSLDAFAAAAESILVLRAEASTTFGVTIPEIDFGGGYAVRYTVLDDVPPAPLDFAKALAQAVARARYEQTAQLIVLQFARSTVKRRLSSSTDISRLVKKESARWLTVSGMLPWQTSAERMPEQRELAIRRNITAFRRLGLSQT